MTENHPQRSVLWPALRRFWPVALVTAVVAGLSTTLLVEATSRPSVVATASYVVPVAPPVAPLLPGQLPVTPSPLPTSPGAASDFAEVYAVLLLEDGAIIDAVSQATGVDREDVVDSLTAVAPPGGNVIRVTATAETRAETDALLGALDAVFAAPTSVTGNIPAGNLRPLFRGAVVESDGLAPLAPVVGAIVGLLLGIGAAVVLERGDSRFRSGEDVRALVTWPVLPLSHDPDDPRAEVLTERVRRAGTTSGTVALVAPRGARPGDLDDLAWVLDEADRGHTADGRLVWTVAGVLRGEGDSEQRAQDADALVLVVPSKARMRHVTAAVRAVEDLAVHPVVVALPSRKRTRRLRGRGGAQGTTAVADRLDHLDGLPAPVAGRDGTDPAPVPALTPSSLSRYRRDGVGSDGPDTTSGPSGAPGAAGEVPGQDQGSSAVVPDDEVTRTSSPTGR
ncbi:hypothetical protein [Aquipuribacter hungaricus]|uniref:Capsular polysaccharide biosynthesis protein n=1 Tax=Aquipuribacter hungaricus TaxID=545624 RepID=A0ABV7WAU1_9MICO